MEFYQKELWRELACRENYTYSSTQERKQIRLGQVYLR
jgi:hypothetical protein